MQIFYEVLVFLVIVFILISLYWEIIGPAFTFIIAVVVLGLAGILTPSEILSGFANEQIVVIIMLLLIGDIIRKTYVVEIIFDRIFNKTKTYKGFLARMTFLIGGFSAFLNNTPLVAVMMPYVHTWCKKNNISPSKLLIPLSYATILGGCATLIGTSTNLIVNGLVMEQDIAPDLKSLGMFDFSAVGIPMLIIGFFYMYFFGNKLLPSKSDVITEFSTNTRKYIVEAQIRQGSKFIGKSIEDAGLRNLNGLYLFEIRRNDISITAVSHTELLKEGDILLFTGETENIAELISPNSGLTFPEVGMLHKKAHTEVIELVISHNSTLINKSVKEANFRGKYDAAIIAIHRNGEKIIGKIGNVKLKAGDAILLLTGVDFVDRSSDTLDFYFISKIRDIRKIQTYKVIIMLGGLTSAILLSALGVISLFMALILLIILLLFIKVASPNDLYKSIDYNLAIIIALSLALGTAMIKTGVADKISSLIITVFIPFGKYAVISGIYLITTILAAFITNKASVAILLPIALTTAINLGLNPLPFALAVSFASAANFMTPIGYQTNLMVYGPGNYSFKDFFKFGFPLTIIYMIVAVTILSILYL